MIVGQQAGTEVPCENDVEGVAHGHVVPETPRFVEERPHRRSSRRPLAQSSPCDISLFFGDVPFDEQLTSDSGQHLGEELFWYPRRGADGNEARKPAAAPSVQSDLDPGRGVYDDVTHPPDSSRTAQIVAAASTLSSSGSGPASNSSMNARNAFGELSSSGLVTTIFGSLEAADALRDTAPGYLELPHDAEGPAEMYPMQFDRLANVACLEQVALRQRTRTIIDDCVDSRPALCDSL